MPLPSTGKISLGDINAELGLSRTSRLNIGGSVARTLAGITNGSIKLSNFRGKGTPVIGSPRTINLNAIGRVSITGVYTYEYIGYSPTPTPAFGSVSPSSLDGVPIQSLYMYRITNGSTSPPTINHAISLGLTSSGDGGVSAITGIQMGGVSFGAPSFHFPGSTKVNLASATWNITKEQFDAIYSAILNRTTPVLIYK